MENRSTNRIRSLFTYAVNVQRGSSLTKSTIGKQVAIPALRHTEKLRCGHNVSGQCSETCRGSMFRMKFVPIHSLFHVQKVPQTSTCLRNSFCWRKRISCNRQDRKYKKTFYCRKYVQKNNTKLRFKTVFFFLISADITSFFV